MPMGPFIPIGPFIELIGPFDIIGPFGPIGPPGPIGPIGPIPLSILLLAYRRNSRFGAPFGPDCELGGRLGR